MAVAGAFTRLIFASNLFLRSRRHQIPRKVFVILRRGLSRSLPRLVHLAFDILKCGLFTVDRGSQCCERFSVSFDLYIDDGIRGLQEFRRLFGDLVCGRHLINDGLSWGCCLLFIFF